MERHVITTKESKGTKTAIKKYGTIQIDAPRMKGVIRVVNYRQYESRDEIDIVFSGIIKVRVDYNSPRWLGNDDIQKLGRSISKIKLNRFIKYSCFKEISYQMKYFGININDYREIKKIKWI